MITLAYVCDISSTPTPIKFEASGESYVSPRVEHVQEFRRQTRLGRARSELEGMWGAVAEGGMGQQGSH